MEAVDTLPATAMFRAMGSDAVVVIDGAEFHVEAAKRRIAELERLWSRFIPDSEISMMNRSPEWVRISQDTLTLLDRSFAIPTLRCEVECNRMLRSTHTLGQPCAAAIFECESGFGLFR